MYAQVYTCCFLDEEMNIEKQLPTVVSQEYSVLQY